jgi:hypothetical protein
MTAMTPGRAPALAFAVMASSASAAQGQTLSWPSDAPVAQWQPTATEVCLHELGRYWQEVQKQAIAAKTGSEKKATREEMCNLLTAYSTAHANWIKYADEKMVTCGIPKQAVDQLKSALTRALDTAKKFCANVSPFRESPPTRVKSMRIAGRPQS